MNSFLRASLVPALFACATFSHGAMLTGEFSPVPEGTNINLTAEGKLDWVHWGLRAESSLNRKATVPPQISDFTVLLNTNLSSGAAYQYADNYNGYSWSDGMQETSATNTTTGVYVVDFAVNPTESNGFQFTVPADTTLKTLKVYVGTYGARGRLQATLSDDPISYSDASLNNMFNGPGGVYTIRFAANSSNQTLTVRWTISTRAQADGNVTLQAAALSRDAANNPPFAQITSPAMNDTFAAPVDIVVSADATDFDGTISRVEFFRNGSFIGASTNAPYSLTLTNVPPGHHRLTAVPVDDGNGTSVSRPVEFFVHSNGGTLNGSASFPPGSVDLSTEGNADWVHWGLDNATSVNRKANVSTQISALTKIGSGTLKRLNDYITASSWSDGTPTASTNGIQSGVFVSAITNGFQFSVPADATPRTLNVYAGLYGGSGNFQVWLSDFSAPAFTDRSLTNAYGNSYAVYTLNYAAASAGQTLNVRYTSDYLFDQDFGNVALHAATLSGPAPVLLFNPQAGSENFTFLFKADSGRTYTVQYTDSLNPVDWKTFTTIIGFGLDETVTDTASHPQRFYRIQTD